MSDHSTSFTKENLDEILKALGKQYRKLNGKNMPAEIVLIGGAAVLANYGFRNMTTDVDAIIHASSSMSDAISFVGDQFDLPVGWLNSDFMNTASYSPKLLEFSQYYRTFSNVLHIRTVSAEYLIAMKLMSGRKYKNDLSDVVGILAEHEKQNSPISLESIKLAVKNLYGSWDNLPKSSICFIEDALKEENYGKLLNGLRESEKSAKQSLVNFDKKYSSVLNEDNVNDIIEMLRNRENSKREIQESEDLGL